MIYFVTETFLTDKTPIGENVDIKKVLPWIETAANIYVKEKIGKALFDDLLTKWNNQDTTEQEDALIEFIKLVISWYAASMSLPDLNNQVTNKGQQRQNGSYSNSSGVNAEYEGQDRYASVGRYWYKEMADFLSDNKDKYPLYKSPDCGKKDPIVNDGFNNSFMGI